jgi:hypothetical protein
MVDILAVIDADIGQAIQASVHSFEGAWAELAPDPIPPRVQKKKLKVVMSETLYQHVRL